MFFFFFIIPDPINASAAILNYCNNHTYLLKPVDKLNCMQFKVMQRYSDSKETTTKMLLTTASTLKYDTCVCVCVCGDSKDIRFNHKPAN